MSINKQNFIKAAGIISAVTSIFGAVFVFEDRYAHSQEMDVQLKHQHEILQFLQEHLQTTQIKILEYLKAQAITRKTVLEMKEDSGSLTSDERVELRNLRDTLKNLQ